MKALRPGYILPSAALTVPSRMLGRYALLERVPEVGDLVYGRIISIGQHQSLENKHGRIHEIHDGTRAIFVFGNRYAPDAFEGVVPSTPAREVDLLARSGMIGTMRTKNSNTKDPSADRDPRLPCR